MSKSARVMRMVAALFLLLSFWGCSEKADPVRTAQKYEGKIVAQPPANRGKDDGWYFVKDGKRRWISDAVWMKKNNHDAKDVLIISSGEFKAIPEDPEPLK